MSPGCQRQPSEQFPVPAACCAKRVVWPAGSTQVLDLGSFGKRRIHSMLNTDSHLDYGDFIWDDRGVPAGRTWILVDLQAQTMSVFRGADEIGSAVTLYGVDDKPTPVGRFKILAKLKDHESSTYDAPMPYTLRLTDDGVSIHASHVRAGVGTHGCLGVPFDFGRDLFAAAKVGDEVIIVRTLSKPVTHA